MRTHKHTHTHTSERLSDRQVMNELWLANPWTSWRIVLRIRITRNPTFWHTNLNKIETLSLSACERMQRATTTRATTNRNNNKNQQTATTWNKNKSENNKNKTRTTQIAGALARMSVAESVRVLVRVCVCVLVCVSVCMCVRVNVSDFKSGTLIMTNFATLPLSHSKWCRNANGQLMEGTVSAAGGWWASGHVACCKIEIGLEIFARNSNFNFQLTRPTAMWQAEQSGSRSRRRRSRNAA